MDYLYSRNIIDKNKLIPRKISKKIINFINFNEQKFEKQKDLRMSKYISYDKLYEIRKNFQKFKKGKDNSSLRNYHIYKFIKKNLPKTTLNFDEKKKKLIIPEINGIRVSLSSLLLNSFNKDDKKRFHFKSNFFTLLKKLFKDAGFKKPHQNEINKFYDLVLKKKIKKEKLIIVTPCCPDYSKIKKGKRYDFTFNSIDDGPGLVATRLKDSIKEIYNFFNNIGLNFEHHIAVGDFEAFGKKNQKRLKLNESSYLDKLKKNQHEINKIFNHKKSFANKTFLEIFGNKKVWNKELKRFEKFFKLNNNESIKKNINNFEKILDSRLSLYKKWYGSLDRKEYEKILISQAAEYASMSFLINQKFNDAIVLGADHYKMSEFYKLGSDKIVFYLKKNYIT